jgi:hypothetical protein
MSFHLFGFCNTEIVRVDEGGDLFWLSADLILAVTNLCLPNANTKFTNIFIDIRRASA